MEVWQLLLVKGNDSFNKQKLPLAEEYYHQAIECLEQKWLFGIYKSPINA